LNFLEGLFKPMANKNAIQNIEIDNIETDFDLEEVEGLISKQLEDSFSDLELLENDRESIANPDSLGKVVLDEVWKQFGNQIGLDMTNETLIQKYDREHPEQYKDIAGSVLQDQQYKDANKAMKEQQKAGTLNDEYTGKNLKRNENANLDHVVSRKELYENQRRKQANLGVADLANKEENLKATNESLNKSKGAKSNKEYVEKREAREKDLIKQNERANKKIDESNMSDVEKRLQKEKNNKRMNDKLAADDELMKKADKEARKAINKDIAVNATKEVGKKAGKDALKAMAVSALFTLLKEIMNGLIRFFKAGYKSFNGFLSEMRESIKSFFSKILSFVKTGASTFIGTIISEIFGPIVSVFKKLASVIKQGVSSLIDAVNYLRDKKNKDKPFSVKVAQVGKIITAGLVGGSALFLGEVFEKFLLTIPGMQFEIPLIGSLANMIGLFLSSLVSGLVGAIVLNLIDKFIAKKVKEEKDQQIIDKKNGIMNLQQVQRYVAENRVVASKENVMNEISENHAWAKDIMQQSLTKIFDKHASDSKNKNTITENQRELLQMQKDLEGLL
jgi:5-methylcytosine-specific restriction endonuclease McrA